jgi:hypothetical protein
MIYRLFKTALGVSLILGLVSFPVYAENLALISGKVTTGPEKTSVSGVRVTARPAGDPAFEAGAPHVSEVTAADGLFRLSVPPGDYYLVAQGADLFAFYGRNPVTVTEDGLADMNLSLVERTPPPAEVTPRVETGFLGRVTFNGEPVEGAIVTVYPDAGNRFRGMGLGMTAPTDATGLFEAPLPPGRYFLVARKRHNEELQGPLQAGDFFGFYPGNPFEVREGQVIDASFSMVKVPEKVRRQADALFGETSISGRVLDAQGDAVEGVKVMLYGDPMMIQRPLYVSHPTDAEGWFVLSFPHGGHYWLVARDSLGGQPLPGQFYGSYIGSADGSLRVANGQKLKGIVIRGGIIR